MTLYTIGYEKREPGEFLALLEENKIEVLADIRINPISRKKGFSKKQLTDYLAEAGIDYAYFRELGTPMELRDRFRADQDYDRFFSDYEEHLRAQRDALQRLAELALSRHTCIMCFERDFNQCHRLVVSKYLNKQFKLKIANL
jgi:uncharacterized protein (DUF488 family)